MEDDFHNYQDGEASFFILGILSMLRCGVETYLKVLEFQLIPLQCHVSLNLMPCWEIFMTFRIAIRGLVLDALVTRSSLNHHENRCITLFLMVDVFPMLWFLSSSMSVFVVSIVIPDLISSKCTIACA